MGLFLYVAAIFFAYFSTHFYMMTMDSIGSQPMPGSFLGVLYQVSGNLGGLLALGLMVVGWFVYDWWIPPCGLVGMLLLTGSLFTALYNKLPLDFPGLFGFPLSLVLATIWFFVK